MDEDLKKEIRGFALQNSSAHGGSTDSKIIIGKILGTRPELRSMTGQIIPEIQSIVKEVNAMSAADQIAELKSEYSDLTKPKPKQKQRDLPELKDAKKGGVVTIAIFCDSFLQYPNLTISAICPSLRDA